jgi:putative inorganic carbon (hco3(-)) transporter
VKAYATTGAGLASSWSSSVARPAAEARWSLAFAGLLFYAVVEYTRLPAMYPFLMVFRLGKVAIVLAALGYLVSPRLRVSVRPATRGLDLVVFIFVLGNLVSVCLAPQQEYVWEGFLNMLGWSVIYFLITRILINSWRVRVFMVVFLLLNLKLAQFAVRLYFGARGQGYSEMQIIMSGGAGAGSAGFFANAADFGLAMCVVWGIAWALLLGKGEKKILRVFLIICFSVFLLAILLCGSRGAVVGAGAIVLAALVRTPRKIGTAVVALLFLCCIWFVLPGASKERFRSAWDWGNDQGASSRITFWKAGLHMFWDHPVFGVGPENFGQVYAAYYGTAWAPHSVYVQALAETGLVGTLSLLALLVLFLRLNARTRKFALASSPLGQRSFEYCLALGLDLALVGYLSSGAFLSVLFYPQLWTLLGLSVAANTAWANKQPEAQVAEKESQERNFALAAS